MIFRLISGLFFCLQANGLYAQGKSVDEILGRESEEVYKTYSIKYTAADTVVTNIMPALLWKDTPPLVPVNFSISIDSEHLEVTVAEIASHRKKYRIEGSKSENSTEYIWLTGMNPSSFIQLIINKKRNIILYIYVKDEMYHLIYHLY